MTRSRRRGRALPEFALIRAIARRFPRRSPDVLAGIGDDAAILRAPRGADLLMTTDLLAEGVHFNPRIESWADIGYKAVAANVSDIAAMGGRPRHLVVALAAPAAMTTGAILKLYIGIAAACRRWDVALVGGDTSASRARAFLSLTVTGLVARGRAIRRTGARRGDDLYVTGTLGDAHAGLRLLSSGRRDGGAAARRFLIARHLRPTPRVDEGALLARHRVATAAIDLSDGLSGDLRHLCEQSGVGAEVDGPALPLSRALRAHAAAEGRDPALWALAGGEDYEILFTVARRHRTKLAQVLRRHRIRATRIGTIRPRAFGVQIRTASGALTPLPRTSYEHFR